MSHAPSSGARDVLAAAAKLRRSLGGGLHDRITE